MPYKHGSEHHNSKLTEKDVRRIRHEYASGLKTQRVLAKEYKVSTATINGIIHHDVWKHDESDECEEDNMRVRIAQCLCGPNGHGVIAFALKDDMEHLSDDEALKLLSCAVDAMIDGKLPGMEGIIHNPYCGICGSHHENYILSVNTSIEFKDWDEAVAQLRKNESDQRATKLLMDALGVSYDAKLRRKKVSEN